MSDEAKKQLEPIDQELEKRSTEGLAAIMHRMLALYEVLQASMGMRFMEVGTSAGEHARALRAEIERGIDEVQAELKKRERVR